MRAFRMMGSAVALTLASFASARPPPDEETGRSWRVGVPTMQQAVPGHLTFPAAFGLHLSAVTLPPAARTARHTQDTRGELDVFAQGEAPVVVRAGERDVVRPGSWCERTDRTAPPP